MSSTEDQSDEKSSIAGEKATSNQDKEVPWGYAVLLMLNSLIGMASLNLPFVYHKSGGIAVALGLQVLICPLIITSFVAMVTCAQMKNCTSYQEVIERWIGARFAVVANVFILLVLYGLSISFFMVVMDQWQKVEQSLQSDEGNQSLPWYLDKRFLGVSSSLVLVLPFCFYRKIDSLKHISSLGTLAYVYIVILVVVKYFTGIDAAKTGSIRTKPEHSYDPILVIPNVILCYQGTLQIVLLYGGRECKGRNHLKTIFISIFFCATFYNLMSIFGFLSFGSCISADILLSYKPVPEVIVGIVAVVVKILFTFPIIAVMLRSVLQTILEKVMGKGKELTEAAESKFRILATIVWFFSSLTISIVVPDVDKMCSIVGSFTSVLSLALPGLCMIKLAGLSSRMKRTVGIILGVIFVTFGVFVSLLTFVERIIIITSSQKEMQCT